MKKVIVAIVVIFITSSCAFAELGPRPAAWCGWQMRKEAQSDPGRDFNRALQWLKYGLRMPGPCIGCIVIWDKGNGRGHVGKIVGHRGNAWIVRSGNDGGAVRERVRSLAGVVGYRQPPTVNAAVSDVRY